MHTTPTIFAYRQSDVGRENYSPMQIKEERIIQIVKLVFTDLLTYLLTYLLVILIGDDFGYFLEKVYSYRTGT